MRPLPTPPPIPPNTTLLLPSVPLPHGCSLLDSQTSVQCHFSQALLLSLLHSPGSDILPTSCSFHGTKHFYCQLCSESSLNWQHPGSRNCVLVSCRLQCTCATYLIKVGWIKMCLVSDFFPDNYCHPPLQCFLHRCCNAK